MRLTPDPARKALRRVFGYRDFRGRQREIIDHVCAGGDALVLMPTGGGKSLCYQIPALVRPGTAIVVSPLIALMKDQVDALREAGVRAASLDSTRSGEEAAATRRALLAGELDLLYLAPERLLMASTLELLGRAQLALFAIDEAHCVSQWGHDFRPEYLQLAVLAERFPGVPRMALTATADPRTRQEILSRLKLEEARVFLSSFDRPNIRYRVTPKRDTRTQLWRFIAQEHPEGAGIVYCLSRKRVEETAAWLREKGRDALPYHAGLAPETRRAHQERFIHEEGVIVVATIAFGMGIDKPDVRFVAHLDLPKSLEAYYQETGRAGRDGQPADAWLAYGLQDVITLRQMVDSSEADEQRKRVERDQLEAMLAFCELTTCRRQALLAHFGETLAQPCGNCDTCLEPVATWDATEPARKALSCIYRTGQRFGIGYVVDVLRGTDHERIRRNRHDQVSTYGIGADLPPAAWRSILRQLLARGLVTVDEGGYGSLRLTEAARPLLRGETALHLRRDPSARRSRKSGRPKGETRFTDPGEQALFDALRRCRRDLAREEGVPPYMVFHDATLEEMVELRPQTLRELGGLSGVGERKLERFGETFLEVLRGDNA